MPEPRVEFSSAILANMSDFGFDISADILNKLTDYYSLLLRWNDRLHLVAPCAPEEFAVRHVLESLLLTKHLPKSATIVDIGSGAGLPIVPSMIMRPDIKPTLIESSQKKSVFLREAMNQLGLKRATIIAKTFEETPTPEVDYLSCRALDELVTKIPSLLSWASAQTALLIFGGPTLHDELTYAALNFTEFLIPHSKQRFLFMVNPRD